MVYSVLPLALLAVVIYGDCIKSYDVVDRSQPTNAQQMRKGYRHQFHPGPIRDHALRGKTYRTRTVHSHVTCAVLCMQEERCKSFNYRLTDSLCELNWAVYAADKSDMQPSNGSCYFDEKYHKECDVIQIPGHPIPEDYSYEFIFARLNSSTKFTLDFAAKGKNDALLALSEQQNDDNIYEIAIGGWGNTKSFIRCGKLCEPAHVVFLADGLMDKFEYRRFWLSYDNGNVQVGKGGQLDPFMEWYDDTRRVEVNYIGIAAYDSPVSWIFYTYCYD